MPGTACSPRLPDKAKAIVIAEQRASISVLQRRMSLDGEPAGSVMASL